MCNFIEMSYIIKIRKGSIYCNGTPSIQKYNNGFTPRLAHANTQLQNENLNQKKNTEIQILSVC